MPALLDSDSQTGDLVELFYCHDPAYYRASGDLDNGPFSDLAGSVPSDATVAIHLRSPDTAGILRDFNAFRPHLLDFYSAYSPAPLQELERTYETEVMPLLERIQRRQHQLLYGSSSTAEPLDPTLMDERYTRAEEEMMQSPAGEPVPVYLMDLALLYRISDTLDLWISECTGLQTGSSPPADALNFAGGFRAKQNSSPSSPSSLQQQQQTPHQCSDAQNLPNGVLLAGEFRGARPSQSALTELAPSRRRLLVPK